MNQNFCKYIVKKYTKKSGTKTVYIENESESEPENWIDEQTYDRIVDSSPFFRRLGGSEYHEKGYTSRGYITIKLVSKSPDRNNKTVRWFIFDQEYPEELIKRGIGDNLDNSQTDNSQTDNGQLDNIQKMQAARLEKALKKDYRFNTGVMSLQEYLNKNEFVEKSITIRNHSKRKIQGCYKKVNDQYSYTLWRQDDTGIDIPKLVYDTFELPERISDNRFE